ncbi:hypothetical protein PMI15_00952 [Polaromonas sp. CF318]|uniref:DUF4261 domain-containing protein n=1 Tax=Polaromonas sp. CF318 TaxID=1144318 RepID=UPI0002711777|nr:DUF4261 domain-containing protein [Polaromonas sp. CF318]EJL87584.1 hypothetical protein PMI15_00952 [Polaromonas sp. CF318]
MKSIYRLVTTLVIFVSLISPALAETSKVKGLAFVVLAEPKMPSGEQVKAALQQRLGNSLLIDKMEAGDQVILFRVAEGTVAIGLVDSPIPNKELEDVCRFAWYWPDACQSVAPHKAHLIVTMLDVKLDKVGAALLLTQVVASFMPDANAIAGYWQGNLQSRDVFLKLSGVASRQRLPVMLWVNYRLSNDLLKGWSISTRGMKEFDLMEIESKDANVDGKSLFTLVAWMSDYLISKGPVILDGDTVGESPAQKIQVRHAPSYWNEGQTVYRVVYPQ